MYVIAVLYCTGRCLASYASEGPLETSGGLSERCLQTRTKNEELKTAKQTYVNINTLNKCCTKCRSKESHSSL